MKVLVTGGAGYIGSHVCLELLNGGHDVVVVDNLSNSREFALRRVQRIAARPLEFHRVDLCDRDALASVFRSARIDAVIHLAALKAVSDSICRPLEYYHNNLTGTITLCQVMKDFGIRDLVFSSSAAVYGRSKRIPIDEREPVRVSDIDSPYGRSKAIIEQVLKDLYVSDNDWNIILLRYFNPIGAHESGEIGEDSNGFASNLLPNVARVAIGRLAELPIYGCDYPTPDGTAVRDYIHVADLSLGHLKALEKLVSNPGIVSYNLGTGRGYSVLEVIAAFEEASGRAIPYRVVPRRPGDVAASYADPSKAERELNWLAARDLGDMCADAWRWYSKHPNGHGEAGDPDRYLGE